MTKEELYSKLDEMVELLGADSILDELSMSMTSKELEDDLRYIDRMDDLRLFDDDEEN